MTCLVDGQASSAREAPSKNPGYEKDGIVVVFKVVAGADSYEPMKESHHGDRNESIGIVTL